MPDDRNETETERLDRKWGDLLQELLVGFARAYRAVKDRESALDFEDLQLHARDLLREAGHRADVARHQIL